MNRRRLQRALFRMQLDPGFAAAVLAGEPEATASTGLDARELEMLRRAPRAGITADPQNRRRHQVLGNIASEYALSVAATAAVQGPELTTGFLSSPELHRAIAEDERLPFAFGAYLQRQLVESDPRLRDLVRLEVELCHARREDVERPAPAAGEVVLAGRARLVELGGGTWAYAEALQAAVSRGAGRPLEGAPTSESDWVLIQAAPAAAPGALRQVGTEPLQHLVAALLRSAVRPWGAADRRRFARERDVEVADVEAFARELLEEGVLRGELDAK